MPPSGFFKKHSHGISTFLQACVEDLIVENKGIRTPELAIQRELRHIKTDMTSTKRGPIPTKVLELTRGFYEALLSKKSADYEELKINSQKLIGGIERDIEAIKIADAV
jgi:hypothetical protein